MGMMRNRLFYRVTAPGITAAGWAVNVVCTAPARLWFDSARTAQLRRGKGVLLGWNDAGSRARMPTVTGVALRVSPILSGRRTAAARRAFARRRTVTAAVQRKQALVSAISG